MSGGQHTHWEGTERTTGLGAGAPCCTVGVELAVISNVALTVGGQARVGWAVSCRLHEARDITTTVASVGVRQS